MASSQVLIINDRETGQPVELAKIVSEVPRVSLMTNSEGKADVSSLEGAEHILISAAGYASVVRSFQGLHSDDFRVELMPSQISLDQVVVSANRWNQSSRNIPAKVLSLTPKDVAMQNPQTAADLLGSSGEVFIQKSQLGGGSPMIRGFSTNRLLYTVDGVRMNTAIFRSGNLQNVISLDPFAIENTEVLFGPGSVMYGSDAIGAVMSFQTLTPQLALNGKPLVTGSAVSRYASANNEKTAHFNLNVGWKKWALLTSFSSFNFGDLRMGKYGPEEYLRPFYVQRIDSTDVIVQNEDPLVQRPTGYSQMNLMQKVRFKPSDAWNFEYDFHYSTTTDYPRYDRHIRLRNALPRSAEWNYGPQVWMMNNLGITNTSNNLMYDQVTLRLAHQYFEESRIDRDFGGDVRYTRLEQVNAVSTNLDFTKALGGSDLFYGLEAVQNDVESTGTDEDITTGEKTTGPSRYPNSRWGSYAAYLTWQQEFNERFNLQLGARYNHFLLDADFSNNLDYYPFSFEEASINSGALTGSAGIVCHPTSSWSLRATASTAFRSPNVDDVGKIFDSEPGSVVIPNPDLQAEYAYNAELGVAKVFGRSVKLDITGYYSLLEDALVRRDFSVNGQDSIVYDGELSQVQAIQNAAVAQVYGVQAALDVKLPAGFGFSSRYNYQFGQEELEDGSTSPSRHAAPAFGLSRLTYSSQGLNLQFYAMYSAGKSYGDLPAGEQGKDYLYAIDNSGKPYSPAWYTLNFKALYQLTETFSVSAGLENLTDQRYRPYSSGIAAAGRNFILSLRADF